MPSVRFFGPARQVTACRSAHVPGGTLAEVLDACCDRFGEGFAELYATSQVWVNGEQSGPDVTLTEDDEVAVIPPVSGG